MTSTEGGGDINKQVGTPVTMQPSKKSRKYRGA